MTFKILNWVITGVFMKTEFVKPQEKTKKWYIVDARDKILGRMATRIATILRGKHKPSYVPFMDAGDFVIVVNAEKIAVTGKKLTDKIYYFFVFSSGFTNSVFINTPVITQLRILNVLH